MKLSSEDIAILEQVKDLIECEFKYHIPLYQLAGRFRIDEAKLRKGFVLLYQRPIYEYLVAVRIQRAKKWLSDTDDPVKAIAYNVGYNSKTLCVQFKKHTGMTPLEWRKKHLCEQLV